MDVLHIMAVVVGLLAVSNAGLWCRAIHRTTILPDSRHAIECAKCHRHVMVTTNTKVCSRCSSQK